MTTEDDQWRGASPVASRSRANRMSVYMPNTRIFNNTNANSEISSVNIAELMNSFNTTSGSISSSYDKAAIRNFSTEPITTKTVPVAHNGAEDNQQLKNKVRIIGSTKRSSGENLQNKNTQMSTPDGMDGTTNTTDSKSNSKLSIAYTDEGSTKQSKGVETGKARAIKISGDTNSNSSSDTESTSDNDSKRTTRSIFGDKKNKPNNNKENTESRGLWHKAAKHFQSVHKHFSDPQ